MCFKYKPKIQLYNFIRIT